MPEFEQSAQGKVLRDIVARVHSDSRIGRRIRNGELRKNLAEEEPEWKVPAGYTLTVIRMKKFSMELLEPEITSSRMIILQLHGGGYVGKLINIYRSFAGIYSELGRGVSVLTPDYRVAPEDPYPAALEDALRAYRWLLEHNWKEEQIIVAGDSSGGGLALALCMYLKNHGKSLPAGIIAMSPWTDLTLSGKSIRKNFHRDPVLGNTKDSLVFNRDYIRNADPSSPYISPLFGDFSGFPPMLIQVGGDEMLLSDSERVAKKAKRAGVRVRLSIYDGMFHLFQMALLVIPESRTAWKEVGRFLEIVMRDKEPPVSLTRAQKRVMVRKLKKRRNE